MAFTRMSVVRGGRNPQYDQKDQKLASYPPVEEPLRSCIGDTLIDGPHGITTEAVLESP